MQNTVDLELEAAAHRKAVRDALEQNHLGLLWASQEVYRWYGVQISAETISAALRGARKSPRAQTYVNYVGEVVARYRDLYLSHAPTIGDARDE